MISVKGTELASTGSMPLTRTVLSCTQRFSQERKRFLQRRIEMALRATRRGVNGWGARRNLTTRLTFSCLSYW